MKKRLIRALALPLIMLLLWAVMPMAAALTVNDIVSIEYAGGDVYGTVLLETGQWSYDWLPPWNGQPSFLVTYSDGSSVTYNDSWYREDTAVPEGSYQKGLNTMEIIWCGRELGQQCRDLGLEWRDVIPPVEVQYLGVSVLDMQDLPALALNQQTVLAVNDKTVRVLTFTPNETGWYNLRGVWMDLGGNFQVYAIDSQGHFIGYAKASNSVDVAMKAGETYYFAVNDINHRAGLTITKTGNPPFNSTNMIRMRQNSTGGYTHLPHNGHFYLGLRYEVEGSSVEVSGDPTNRYDYGQTEQLTIKAIGLGDSVIRFYGAGDVLVHTVNVRVEQLWWQRLFSLFGIPVPHTSYLINPGNRMLIF